MILADTSVLIRHYRNPSPTRTAIILQTPAVVCSAVELEFWAGARTAQQIVSVQSVIDLFGRIDTPEPIWEIAGKAQAQLGAVGLNVPILDTLIATLAVETKLELWTYDAHFQAMVGLMPGLTLFQEP